jgi:hypothetical protein
MAVVTEKNSGKVGIQSAAPWLMLFSRTGFFVLFQLLIAGCLAASHSPAAWKASTAWWMISALCTNLSSIGVLAWLWKKEGKRYFQFYQFSRQTVLRDLGVIVLFAMIMMPVAMFPNQWLATALFGSQEVTTSIMFQPLPLWAKIISILFPLSIAFAELPTYFGYCMPRLEQQTGNSWIAWGLASFFLALQHIALPLVFDWRFIIWRLGMFIPLAFLMGLCIKLRPRLFPYLMVMHALLDMSLVAIIFTL